MRKEWNKGKKAMKGKVIRKILSAMAFCMACMMALPILPVQESNMNVVHAGEISDNSVVYQEHTSNRIINDDDRAEADADMLY